MIDGEELVNKMQEDPKLRALLLNPKGRTVKSARHEAIGRSPLEIPEIVSIEGDELSTAFTSDAFKKRAQSVITRAGKTKEESGFGILSDGSRIIYTPVAVGTSGADSKEEALFRGKSGGSVGLEDLVELPRDWVSENRINVKDFRTIVVLHTHPSPNAFSITDLETYDNMLSGIKSPTRASMRPDVSFGIFSNQFPGNDYKGAPSAVRLFMFQGPASSTEYQASQIRGFDAQKAILERSGMKVTDVTLPINNQVVDFSPLESHFGITKPA